MTAGTYGGDKVFDGDIIVTAADILTYTGTKLAYDIIADAIPLATSTIEVITGAFLVADDREVPLFKADAAWIKRAIIYQTLWQLDHPDSLSVQNFSSLSQDGQSLTNHDELNVVLAPLAKRALKQCSWAKHGTIRMQSPFRIYTQVDATVSDNHGGWTNL